jgi:hypothetical protein
MAIKFRTNEPEPNKPAAKPVTKPKVADAVAPTEFVFDEMSEEPAAPAKRGRGKSKPSK